MEILTHQYNSFEFGQLAEDSTIGGKRIPKGYVNATAMCQVNRKKLNDWSRLKTSKAYLAALSSETGIPVSLFETLDVGNPTASKTQIRVSLLIEVETDYALRGTWTHPEVAIEVARWISPVFAVWANRVIRLVLADQFTPKTTDAAIAQTQLKDKLERIMDLPDPWRRFYDRDFCDRG